MDTLVFKRGFLDVKGRVVKKWRKSWFKLHDSVFSYFNDSENQNDLLESLSLADGVKVEKIDKKEAKKDFAFRLVKPNDKNWVPLIMSADTEQEQNEWIKFIQFGIDLSSPQVFGVDLSVVIKRSGRPVAPVIEKCLAYLKNAIQVQGLFRVSGPQTEVMSLKTAFDKGENVNLASVLDVHVVSNLLKLYLRELPNPLLTSELYDKFIDTAVGTTADQCLERLRNVIFALPLPHRNTLQTLVQFVAQVSTQAAVNMMTPQNLSVVFGPTILRTEVPDASKMDLANLVTERIITNFDNLFQGAPSPTITPAAITNLPPGWQEYHTTEGRPYYFNPNTQQTLWELPTLPAPAPPSTSATPIPPPAIPPTLSAPPTVPTQATAPSPTLSMRPKSMGTAKPIPVLPNAANNPLRGPLMTPGNITAGLSSLKRSESSTVMPPPPGASPVAPSTPALSSQSSPLPPPPSPLSEDAVLPISPIESRRPVAPSRLVAPNTSVGTAKVLPVVPTVKKEAGLRAMPVIPGGNPLAHSTPEFGAATQQTTLKVHSRQSSSGSGSNSPSLVEEPDTVESLSAKVKTLEAKLAASEKQHSETADQLAKVFAILERAKLK